MKTIETENEYKEALKAAYLLMDAKPDTQEEVDLEELCIVIENYENIHYPIDKPDAATLNAFRKDQEGNN